MRTNFKTPQLTHLALSLALFIVLLAGERTAAAATTNVILTAIGGGGDRSLPAGDFTAVPVCATGVLTSSSSGRPVSESRFALEFDLSSIPPGSLIHTANLRLRTSRADLAGATAIYGYAGNGVFEMDDLIAGSLVTIHTPTTSAAEFVDVTTFIVERLSNSDHWAGFAMRQEPLGSRRVGWDCPNNTVPPLLTVEYSAPDTTPPVITPSVVGTLGENDWYVSNVTVSWSVTDAESSITSQDGCDATTITSDTAAMTLTCTASSAGGPASQSITVKRDATLPAISAAATSAPNAAGWYNSDVTVQFTCTDALSGIAAGSCPASQTLSSEGAAVASTAQTVKDAAGNTSAASNIVTVQIDKTAPTLNPVISPNPVLQGAAATVTAGAADGLSGLASQSCDPLDTSSVGAKSVTCTATDNAGNSASVTVAYTITPAGTVVGFCGGYEVRQVGSAYSAAGWNGTIKVGTKRNDTLTGTSGPDLILGLGGNDLIDGKDGDDVLCGGDGVDLLAGFAGNDYLDGGNGNDVLNGGDGDHDQLIGGDGNDVLLDGDGVINAQGGPGNDLFTLALRNGWRDTNGETRFAGRLAAGYGNDTVVLVILDRSPFFVDVTGDERDNPASPLEGKNDGLGLLGNLSPAPVRLKFEKALVVSAEAEAMVSQEAGAEFLTEPVGEGADAAQPNRVFLPVASR